MTQQSENIKVDVLSPYNFIVSQVSIIRKDIEKVRLKIDNYEKSRDSAIDYMYNNIDKDLIKKISFTSNHVDTNTIDHSIYEGWIKEREVLYKYLHELLLSLSPLAREEVTPIIGKNKLLQYDESSSLTNGDDTFGFFIDRSSSEGGSHLNRDSSSIEQDCKRQKNIMSCDSKYGLELEKYDLAKKKLAGIMREFSNNMIHFKSIFDDSNVYISDYQRITLECQTNNKQHSEFIKGETISFKTNYSKITSVYTTTELFIPEFEVGKKPNKKKIVPPFSPV